MTTTDTDAVTRAAIAEQEEHIKRTVSCRGVVGVDHAPRLHGARLPDGSAPSWMQCVVCGVTATGKDYAIKVKAGRA